MERCKKCGKLLTQHKSISRGMGQVCFYKQKIKDQAEPELFGKSKFIYDIKNFVIRIEDIGNENNRTVTNDIENVLKFILTENNISPEDLPNYKIIYKDSAGNWDGVKLINGVAQFIPGGSL